MPVKQIMEFQLRFRRWQRNALAAWEDEGRRGVIEVVTGGGKTVFAFLCMRSVCTEYPGLAFVVIVPTIALLDQWYVALQEDVGLVDDDIACWSGRGKPKAPRLVNIMVINTARDEALSISRAGHAMLIVDECHHAGSPMNSKALIGDYIASLGLSATPEREYDDAFDTLVAPRIGPIIYRYGLEQAAKDGILSPFELVNVEVDLLEDERREYDALSRRIAIAAGRSGDDASSDEQIQALLRRRARVSALASARIPVAVHLVEQHRGARTIIFHEDIKQAEVILNALKDRGHSATIYHSRVGGALRRDNLRLFRRGVYDVLVSCRALDEGVNIPEVQVAVIASATASTRQRVQRLGRVLRPAPGKDGAVIYTVFATDVEKRRLAKEQASLEGCTSVSWRRSGYAR